MKNHNIPCHPFLQSDIVAVTYQASQTSIHSKTSNMIENKKMSNEVEHGDANS